MLLTYAVKELTKVDRHGIVPLFPKPIKSGITINN